MRRAGAPGRPGKVLCGDAGQAEVEDLGGPLGRQEEILRLDVAVHDPTSVGRGETPRDLGHRVGGLSRRDRPAGEPFPERPPGEELEDREGHPFFPVEIVYPEDVGVGKRRDRPRLALESSEASGSRDSASGSTLIATSRPSLGSRAR